MRNCYVASSSRLPFTGSNFRINMKFPLGNGPIRDTIRSFDIDD